MGLQLFWRVPMEYSVAQEREWVCSCIRQPCTPDPIRLVKFSGGLTGTITTIISSGNNDISAANNYVSVRVKYEPTADNWSMYIRDDGGSSWADPSAGVSNQKGSTISDNTYTSISLTHFGFYWAYATAAVQSSQFDNFGVC